MSELMPEQTVEDEDDPARRRGWGWGMTGAEGWRECRSKGKRV